MIPLFEEASNASKALYHADASTIRPTLYPLSFTKSLISNKVRSYTSIIHPEDTQKVEDAVAKGINQKRQFTVEYRILNSSGESRWVFKKGQGVFDDDEKLVCLDGVIIDITERKQAEEALQESREKLARSEKMESLGLMAGGIAHDLNNILSGIVSYPDLLLLDLPEDSNLRKPIETIQNSGLKAAEIVADLLTVARGAAVTKEISNLNTLIEQYINSAEHKKLVEANPGITFKTKLDSELLNVSCSPIHIGKSLMNLVMNSTEAIGGNGAVTISTANRYLDEPQDGYKDMLPGEYVVMAVSDNGTGIPEWDLNRIFEPFYTKKTLGRSGTGLGLAIVWNTVQDHNGCTVVNSSTDGTIFELCFPVTREDLTAMEKKTPIEEYLGRGEKILVVDDEESQREIACSMLTRLGYDATTVPTGEDAVEFIKEQPVNLVILDMIMSPGIDGWETYKRIAKIRPGQKAIIASGFSETDEVRNTQLLGAGKYIRKPYTIRKLGHAVQDELKEKYRRP
jgi:two-component system cell cycle sensor histidine kinase/response regulator CckA